jgi:hypothetical protein
MPEPVDLPLNCAYCGNAVDARYVPEPELVEPVTVNYKCPHCEVLQPIFGLPGRLLVISKRRDG